MKKLFLSLLIALSLLCSFTPLSFAAQESSHFNVFDVLSASDDPETADIDEDTSGLSDDLKKLAEEKKTSVVGAVILKAINILMLLIGTFSVVVVMIGGIILITADGDETKIDRGKAILTQTALGLIMAFCAYFIVSFILSFFY